MNGREFLDKMELVDPAYVEAAERAGRQKRPWRKWSAMAACCTLVLAGALLAAKLWESPQHVAAPPVPNPDGTIERGEMPETWPEHPILRPGDEGYIEPAPEPYREDPNSGIMFGVDKPFANDAFLNFKPMIDRYGGGAYSADKSVTEGGLAFSPALQGAMEEYGEEANYRVIVELFSEGVQVASGSEAALREGQRLTELGYIVAMEAYTESEERGEYVAVTTTYYFTLHATHEQLRNFPVHEDYGYYLMLYGEYFDPLCLDGQIVYNTTYGGG